MGMSAAQARLLSITARITDNELRSQMLTNSKLRLADKSSAASEEYMEALNSQKLTFKTYNEDGTVVSSNLTPQLLYTYQPLKNQYGIQNSAGQYLVSGTDAKNYEASSDLKDFLSCYELVDETLFVGYEEQQKEYDEYLKDLADYNKYLDELNSYNKYQENLKKYNDYLADYAQYEKDYAQYQKDYEKYVEDYERYQNSLSSKDLYAVFSGAVGTSDTATGNGASYCYYMALNGNPSCYLHLLNELLDFDGVTLNTTKVHTATNGASFKINGVTGGMWGQANAEMHEVSDGLNETDSKGNPLRYCDGDDDLNSDGLQNILAQAAEEGRAPTELEILQSDYVLNDDGTYSLKSLKQKAIDMYYIIANRLITGATDMRNLLINFTDGDMKKLTLDEPEKPVRPVAPAKVDEPIKVDEPAAVEEPEPVQEPEKPMYDIIVNDSDKGQWYVNLWYMMNGSESSNKVHSATKDDGITYYGVSNNEKNAKTSNYKEIDSNLLSSSDWLEFALTNGVVTLSQASYYNPSTDGMKQPDLTCEGYTWNSIIYSNASDIVSVEDSAAIARAEVDYENTLREIENDDKKLDQDLKKLDTEHSALQTEYESIKSVIDKNVERSFKAFS